MSEIKILNCNIDQICNLLIKAGINYTYSLDISTNRITIIDKPEPNEIDEAAEDLSKIISFFTGMRMTNFRESLDKSIKTFAQAIIKEAKK